MAKKVKKPKQSGKKHRLRTVIIFLIILCAIGAIMPNDDDPEESETEVNATAFIETEFESETQVESESEIVVEAETKTEFETETESETESEPEESHIYDNAEIIDMMNGSQTEKIGKVSIIYADSDSITKEILEDWYFNYVSVNDYNYCLIVYTDIESTGCYAINGIVQENLELKEDESGLYYCGDDSNATMYLPQDSELIDYDTLTSAETEVDSELVTDSSEKTVYITDTGSKYHCNGCRYLGESQIAITLSDAVEQGYTACSVCNP